MAELTEVTTSSDDLPMAGLKDNPLLRQLAVMVGIAASVALGVAVVLWSQTPNMAPLYGNLGQKDAAAVVAALEQAGIPFRLDEQTGMVLVPNEDVQKLRMQLASQGLPNTTGTGYEILQQEASFSTSRMVEQARYHHAIESELARTISTITGVESARVHLALPKQSVFVRKRKMPSASVVLKLFAGRRLEQTQVDAIVHLVAASIPELEAGRVTVVDHKGRLLSERQSDEHMKLSATQFEYTQKIEEHYRQRVEDILAPILGPDSIQAQVTADIDFTVSEQTQERFNPEQPALRSEQVSEQLSNSAGGTQGVPGALSNQPPAPGVAPEQAVGGDGETTQTARNSNKNATRNYELDRVVSHTRQSPASIRRLSVAVVVDDVLSTGADGAVVRRQRTPEEIERITQLVQEAVGFDARRGDSVKVINSAFQAPAPVEALPELPIWEQAWVWDLAKQVGGGLVVMLLIFGVLRPTLKKLTATPTTELPEAMAAAVAGGGAVPVGGAGEGRGAIGMDGKSAVQLTGPASYEETMDAARKLVDNDPKRVAQLVKTWITEDAG